MRRIAVLVLVGVTSIALAPAVLAAGGPVHERSPFVLDVTFAPGEMCDFEYHQTVTGINNVTTWGDPAAPTKQIVTGPIEITHTNVGSGDTLTEKDSYQIIFEPGDARYREMGLAWHLRDADGRLVVVQAGLLAIDLTDGSLVKITPNRNPDFAAVLCPALGGSPAS